MKVSDYLPNLYNKNVEMNNIIYSEEDELENKLKPYVDSVFKNTFSILADENGISMFEDMLGIPSDPIDEDLDFRRARVISRLRSSIPFTEKFLQESLDNYLGENNWTYTLNYNNYTLVINSLKPGNAWYRELLTFLDSIIPCNIDWSVILFAATWQQVQDTFGTWQTIYDEEMTWQDVLDGEWIS